MRSRHRRQPRPEAHGQVSGRSHADLSAAGRVPGLTGRKRAEPAWLRGKMRLVGIEHPPTIGLHECRVTHQSRQAGFCAWLGHSPLVIGASPRAIWPVSRPRGAVLLVGRVWRSRPSTHHSCPNTWRGGARWCSCCRSPRRPPRRPSRHLNRRRTGPTKFGRKRACRWWWPPNEAP